MKKIFCLALILFGTFAVIAQERIITEAEFKAASVESFRKLADSHRRTEVTINGLNGLNRITSKLVVEQDANRSSRMTSEFDSPTIKRNRERIRINGVYYRRENGGEWQIENAPFQNKEIERNVKLKLSDNYIEKEKTVVYKYLGTEEIEGKKVDGYLVTESKTIVKADTGQELNSVQTNKYLFGKDAFFRREESERKLVVKSVHAGFLPTITNSQTLHTRDWQNDPDIKIEAPVK